MTEDIKRRMMLEERYATLRSNVRSAYTRMTISKSEGKMTLDQIEDLKIYLNSCRTEMEEIEAEIGDRIRELYGNDKDWWKSV